MFGWSEDAQPPVCVVIPLHTPRHIPIHQLHTAAYPPRHAQVAEADVKVDRVVEQGVEAAHADEGRGPEALQEGVVHEVGGDERVLGAWEA